MQPSSQDLHPRTGARFVFEREGQDQAEDTPVRYRVHIYLPGDGRWTGALRWTEGEATLDAGEQSGAVDEADLTRARDEALKLARVLKRDPKAHMVRWRSIDP